MEKNTFKKESEDRHQNNEKNSPWNLSFLQKKRLELQQQHERRKRVEKQKQEDLKRQKKLISEKKILLNTVNNSSSKTILNIMQKYAQPHKQSNQIQEQTNEIYSPIKKVGIQEILQDGRIVKIIERTLTFDEYKVLCLYDGEIVELIASKDQIVRNNIIPFLDFYEKLLGFV